MLTDINKNMNIDEYIRNETFFVKENGRIE